MIPIRSLKFGSTVLLVLFTSLTSIFGLMMTLWVNDKMNFLVFFILGIMAIVLSLIKPKRVLTGVGVLIVNIITLRYIYISLDGLFNYVIMAFLFLGIVLSVYVRIYCVVRGR